MFPVKELNMSSYRSWGKTVAPRLPKLHSLFHSSKNKAYLPPYSALFVSFDNFSRQETVFSVTLSKSCPTTKVFQRVLFLFTHFRLWTSIIVSQAQVISHWFGILWIQYFLFVVTAYVTFLKSGRKNKIKLHRMHKKTPALWLPWVFCWASAAPYTNKVLCSAHSLWPAGGGGGVKRDSTVVKVNIVLLKSQVFLSYHNGGLRGKYLHGYQHKHCIC